MIERPLDWDDRSLWNWWDSGLISSLWNRWDSGLISHCFPTSDVTSSSLPYVVEKTSLTPPCLHLTFTGCIQSSVTIFHKCWMNGWMDGWIDEWTNKWLRAWPNWLTTVYFSFFICNIARLYDHFTQVSYVITNFENSCANFSCF